MLIYNLLHLFKRQVLAKFLEGELHIFGGNQACAIRVEDGKHDSQFLVAEEGLHVHCCCNELWVVYDAVARVIQVFNHSGDLLVVNLHMILDDERLQFCSTYQAGLVRVKFLELLGEVRQFFRLSQFD